MRERIALGVAAALTVALIVALHQDVELVRGPDYFRWPRTPLSGPALLALLLPVAPALWAVWRGRVDARSALAFFGAASLFALTLAWLRGDGPPLAYAADLLEDVMVHGYLSTARDVCAAPDWMATYPSVMAEQGVHVRVHPPGLVGSYCLLFAATGAGRAAAVMAALLLGAVAASTPVWVQALATRLDLEPRAALIAAALAALSPASAAFFPSFDAAHPALVTALLLFWVRALDEDSLGFALASGAVVWALSTFSYVLLAVALPLSVLLVLRSTSPRRAGLLFGAGAASFAGLYLLAWLTLGLDPFGVFAQALANQAENLETWFPTRAWPRTIGWDLWDFALGLSAIVAVPALLHGQRALRSRVGSDLDVALIGLALPITAALSGQVTTETFRTWMFMAPAVYLCAACELSRWRPRYSSAFLLCSALLSASVVHQLAFVWR